MRPRLRPRSSPWDVDRDQGQYFGLEIDRVLNFGLQIEMESTVLALISFGFEIEAQGVILRPVRYRDFNSSASIFTYLTPTRISLQHHTWTYLSVLCFTCLRLGLHTSSPVVKVDRRIRWHHTTTILRLRIGARLTRYRNCKFDNFARTISRHADGISRYSVPPSAGPLLPLNTCIRSNHDRWGATSLNTCICSHVLRMLLHYLVKH